MSYIVAPVLLFVAAGLLVLGGVMAARASGSEPSRWTSSAMAGMLGMALGFLLMVLSISPLGFFPVGLAVLLVTDWVRRGRGTEVGAFLMGGGAMWTWAEFSVVINGLSDPAVRYSGWTPVSLAASLIALLFGGALVALGLLKRGGARL